MSGPGEDTPYRFNILYFQMVQDPIGVDQAESAVRHPGFTEIPGCKCDIPPPVQQAMQTRPLKTAPGQIKGGDGMSGVGHGKGIRGRVLPALCLFFKLI